MKYPRLDFVPKPKKYKTCPYCGQDGEHYWHHVFNGSLKRNLKHMGLLYIHVIAAIQVIQIQFINNSHRRK